MFSRRNTLVLLAGLSLPVRLGAGASASEGGSAVDFHYFGALDCPLCAGFRANGLVNVQQRADDAGVNFVMRETASLRDLHKAGVFDELNPLWLKAVRRSGHGVPAFVLVDGGKFIDSRAGEWRDLLVLAMSRAAKNKSETL